MEAIISENLAVVHHGLIPLLTCAQLLIVYFLSESSNPPRGLGLFTAYFMAALMGWILLSLQWSITEHPLALDIQAIIGLLSSYILFLAAGERAGLRRGRFLLGGICLVACLSAFYFPPVPMFQIQLAVIGLLWAVAGAACAWRAWTRGNIGDAILAFAGVLLVAGFAGAWWQWLEHRDLARAQALAFGTHSSAYALVVVGFLASVLLEYQQHLSHLATQDPLTRLLNRRGLEDAIFVSLAGASRNHAKTSVILLDIDHFRQVNDSFGHHLGDRVIQHIAGVLQQTCRASDVVARVGGEEFLVVMPNTDESAARAVAERVRAQIADHALELEGHEIALTVSLGVTTVAGATDLDSLTREADRAIFLAKRSGRNRVAAVDSRPRHFRNDGAVTDRAG